MKRITIKKKYVSSLNVMREKIGLPPFKGFNSDRLENERLHIALFPEWFGMRQKDWPSRVKLVGFPLFDEASYAAHPIVDNFIAKYGGPILFTTGTGVHCVGEFFREGRKICELLNIPGLFVGGGDGREVLAGCDICLHIDYVDFEYVLPQCKAIVHHGGIGTTAQAIRASIPQIIRPLSFDQPDNGNRIHKLGLGTFIFPKLFKAKTVAPIIKALMDSDDLHKHLATYSADIKRNNSIRKSCDFIEEKLFELNAFDNSVEECNGQLLPENMNHDLTSIPLIKQRKKGGDGLACIAMLLNRFGIDVDVDSLIHRYPEYCRGIQLQSIMNIFKAYGLVSRLCTVLLTM